MSYIDISFSSRSGIFSVEADAKFGKIPKSAKVQISLSDIEHKLERLGAELEHKLSQFKNWL